MIQTSRFLSAVPILASLNIQATVEFYARQLGFSIIHAEQGSYAIVERDSIELHFFACDDPAIPKATACRIQVQGIRDLYADYQAKQLIHPNGPLSEKAWGSEEFAILDLDGNLLTFFEFLN